MTDSSNSGSPLYHRVQLAADFLRSQLPAPLPRVAIILGSGLGSVSSQLASPTEIPYSAIPSFPVGKVDGHRGRILSGTLNDTPALIFEGRAHAYEGFSPADTTFPIRVIAALGIQSLVVTNAAGAVREDLRPGDLVAISDHINLTGLNPAAGPDVSDPDSAAPDPNPRLGPRFFDMSAAYSPRLRSLAIAEAARQGWTMPIGVYIGVLGPSFETPAEIRAFRTMGADLVGMSTVLEVITARQLRLEVCGISCVTNMAAGILDQPLTHGEVTLVGKQSSARLGALLSVLIPQIATE
jgi:purine-nucleoside phosphorylase